jgi:hypothetical protein
MAQQAIKTKARGDPLMEIVITAFATLVAAGCFFAILSSDIKDANKGKEPSESSKADNKHQAS